MQARCNAINVPGSSLNLLLNLNKIIKSALLWKIIFIWNEDENRSTWISLIWIMISINGDRRDHNNKQNVSSASDGEPEGEWMGEERKKGRQLVYINRSLSLSLWSTPFYTEGLFVLLTVVRPFPAWSRLFPTFMWSNDLYNGIDRQAVWLCCLQFKLLQI